jgi:hypothetical protein
VKTRRINSILLWAFPLVFFLLSSHLPFWGDGIASISKAAVRIYQEGLNRPWNYPSADPGHPTLFPWLIALFWKIFGFSLWVPHLMVAVQLYFLARIIYLISEPLKESEKSRLLLLIFISPLTVSQGTGISLQMPLTLCFFSAYYFLLRGQRSLFLLFLCFMMLIHLQAALLYVALVLFDFGKNFKEDKNYWKKLLALSIPGCALLAWGWFHYLEFGWAFFTPNYERSPPGMKEILYNLGISAWRLTDLGYFMLTLPAGWFLLQKIRTKTLNDLEKAGLLILLTLCIGIPVIFAYPPNHRYIFPVYLIAAVIFMYWLQQQEKNRQAIWFSAALIFLISGNFWFYPGKCQGDQNLVHLEYRKLEKQLLRDVPGATIYSYAPLNNASLYTHLKATRDIHYSDLYSCDPDTLTFIAESNVNCEFTADQKQLLAEHFWVHSYEGQAIFINLYLNKKASAQYPHLAFNKARKKGFWEKKTEELKKRLGK